MSVENSTVDDLKAHIGQASRKVPARPGGEVVEYDDLVTVVAQPVNEMRPDETGSASDENTRTQAGDSPSSITMRQL